MWNLGRAGARDGAMRPRFAAWLLGAVMLGGCASRPQVEVDGLPVRRVVIYRNGVAYFERSGTVSGEEVKFRLRQRNVGDFLATLAILEEGGSTVRAASFPVEVEDGAAEAPPGEGPEPKPLTKAPLLPKSDLRVVTLELGDGRHDLKVGYLAETPLWRPSYRLVIGDNGQADLQAWGIVLNQSGEDWKNVEIALVAGAPIAFESTLGNAVIPPRPVVTDQGEVVSQVPEASTAYEFAAPAEAPAPPASPEADAGMAAEEMADERDSRRTMAESAPKKAMARAPSPSMMPQPAGGRGIGGVGQVLDPSRLASIQPQGGGARYEVPSLVSIPNETATMVLLVSARVAGEAVHLFAPDPGVSDSYRHPFRVARFKNTSGGLLEKGPIAVFEKGAFLGQGLVDSLPDGARTIVPFALVRSLSVESEQRSDQRGSHLYSLQNGTLKLEVEYALVTTYKAQNGDKEAARLMIRHQRQGGAKLNRPPTGTEEDLTNGTALVPLPVAGHGKAEVSVEEITLQTQYEELRSVTARAALADYLRSGRAAPADKPKIEALLAACDALIKLEDQRVAYQREQSELERLTRETRLSIQAIEKNTAAQDLRSQLTARLSRSTARLDELTKLLIEGDLRRSELEVRLKEASLGLSIQPPDRR